MPSISFVVDRSTISRDELYQDPMNTGTLQPIVSPVIVQSALYIIFDGYAPSDLGITSPSQTTIPNLTLEVYNQTASSVIASTTLEAVPSALLFPPSAPPLGDQQLFAAKLELRFSDSAWNVGIFGVGRGSEIHVRVNTVTPAATTPTPPAVIYLTRQGSGQPYMLDGDVSWLSKDLRVFRLRQFAGAPATFGTAVFDLSKTPLTFLNTLLTELNEPANQSLANDWFMNQLSTDPSSPSSTLTTNANWRGDPVGQPEPVANFAIARVRNIHGGTDTNGVRVFFRVFNTPSTGFTYDGETANAPAAMPTYNDKTYGWKPQGMDNRRISTAGYLPTANAAGEREIVTLPFFATARVGQFVESTPSTFTSRDEATQGIGDNERTLAAVTNRDERSYYFGAWLDFNEATSTVKYDDRIGGSPVKRNVTEILLNKHVCIVAEINRDDQAGAIDGNKIFDGAGPGSSQMLAQRNLVVVNSDNPGSTITHTVFHTFSLAALDRIQPPQSPTAVPREASAIASYLLIDWTTLPAGQRAKLRFSTDNVTAAVLQFQRGYPKPWVRALDSSTMEVTTGGMTVLPVPFSLSDPAGLFTIELPSTVVKGEQYRVQVLHIDRLPGRVIGAFEVAVLISSAELLKEEEALDLSRAKYQAQWLSTTRWKNIWPTYTQLLADRLQGFGGNPDKVEPSLDGSGLKPGWDRPAQKLPWWVWLVLLVLLILIWLLTR